MRLTLALAGALVALPVWAQTPTPTGVLIYGQLNLVNTVTATGTGLTRGMSNASVREVYYEFDDATSAPNTLTTAFTAHQVEVGPSNGDKVGGILNVYNCCTSSGGFILGGDSTATADVNSQQVVLAAHQFEVTTLGAAQVGRRYGIEITIDPGSQTAGTQFDAAIAIDNMGNPGSEWHNIFSVGDSEGTLGPVNQNSNIIHANGPATIANFCDCGNWMVLGNILNFANFRVDGQGNIAVRGAQGVNCSGPPSANYTVTGGVVTHC